MKSKILGLLMAIGLIGPLTAGATTITFSEVGVGNSGWISADGLVRLDWIWSLGQLDGHSHILSSGGNPGAYEQGHGQDYQGLRLTAVGGGPLTLVSFDLRGGWRVGTVHDPILGTTYFSPNAWTTQLVNLTGNAIYIYASSAGIQTGAGRLDNIVVRTPEPGTLALLGLGLVGLGLSRRRKAA